MVLIYSGRVCRRQPYFIKNLQVFRLGGAFRTPLLHIFRGR